MAIQKVLIVCVCVCVVLFLHALHYSIITFIASSTSLTHIRQIHSCCVCVTYMFNLKSFCIFVWCSCKEVCYPPPSLFLIRVSESVCRIKLQLSLWHTAWDENWLNYWDVYISRRGVGGGGCLEQMKCLYCVGKTKGVGFCYYLYTLCTLLGI